MLTCCGIEPTRCIALAAYTFLSDYLPAADAASPQEKQVCACRIGVCVRACLNMNLKIYIYIHNMRTKYEDPY